MTRPNLDRIQQILAAAYREKEAGMVSDGWQQKVMRRVRTMPAPTRRASLLDDLTGLSWRFAAVACVLVLVLSAVALQSGFQTEYEMASLFLSDPLDFSLVQSMEIF